MRIKFPDLREFLHVSEFPKFSKFLNFLKLSKLVAILQLIKFLIISKFHKPILAKFTKLQNRVQLFEQIHVCTVF